MIQRIVVLSVMVWMASATMVAQQAAPDPMNAYISPTTYSNAHFGFAVGIPKDCAVITPSPKLRSTGLLFTYQIERPSLTVLMIMAKPGPSSRGKDAKASFDEHGGMVEKKLLNGHEVWEQEETKKTPAGKMHLLTVAMETQGQVVVFFLSSFDGNQFEQSRKGLEQISFFDPAKAKEMAGAGAYHFPAEIRKTAVTAALSTGTLDDGLYHNAQLGLTFGTPKGWIAQGTATQQAITEAGHRAAYGTQPTEDTEHQQAERCSKNLVWLSLPTATTGEVQSKTSVVLQAFDLGCMPGVSFPQNVDEKDKINAIIRIMKNMMPGSGEITITAGHAFKLEQHLILELDVKMNVMVEGKPVSGLATLRMAESKGYMLSWMLIATTPEDIAMMKALPIHFDP
jgi:hypothetical protein